MFVALPVPPLVLIVRVLATEPATPQLLVTQMMFTVYDPVPQAMTALNVTDWPESNSVLLTLKDTDAAPVIEVIKSNVRSTINNLLCVI